MTQDSYRCYHRPCVRTKRSLRDLLAAVKQFEAAMTATGLTEQQAVILRQLSVQRFLVSRFGKVEESK